MIDPVDSTVEETKVAAAEILPDKTSIRSGRVSIEPSIDSGSDSTDRRRGRYKADSDRDSSERSVKFALSSISKRSLSKSGDKLNEPSSPRSLNSSSGSVNSIRSADSSSTRRPNLRHVSYSSVEREFSTNSEKSAPWTVSLRHTDAQRTSSKLSGDMSQNSQELRGETSSGSSVKELVKRFSGKYQRGCVSR